MSTCTMNPKSQAWDLVAGLFWKVGRKNARPNNKMIHQFLAEIQSNTRVLIVGASTKTLIEETLKLSSNVTVIDFSKQMCLDLKNELHNELCKISVHDVLIKPADPSLEKQDIVIAERLINRFSLEETKQFFKNVSNFLSSNGLVRLTIKLGLYEIDKILITEGNRKGTLANFYDVHAKTIDYSKAKLELVTSVVQHGEIPREILIEWYQGRGEEARFDNEDILELISSNNYSLIKHELIDDETDTFYYEFKV